MAVWTGNDCHSLWRRKLSHGGAESSPRSHDQHMATNARLKTKASCLTWALLLDRWEMSHFELPSEVLSMLAFCISHAGGLRWRYPLTWFSALPLSKAGKKKKRLDSSVYTMALPSSPNLFTGADPALLCSSFFRLMAGWPCPYECMSTSCTYKCLHVCTHQT